jgi:hypothetical protein
MARTREKMKGRRSGGRFLSLPHVVLEHTDFVSLSNKAVKLLVDIAMQYNGNNNGDLCATFSIMKKRNWSSNDQLQKALKELRNKNFVVLTRQGGRKLASLYAITWKPIDECKGKLDVKSTKLAPRSFRKK